MVQQELKTCLLEYRRRFAGSVVQFSFFSGEGAPQDFADACATSLQRRMRTTHASRSDDEAKQLGRKQRH